MADKIRMTLVNPSDDQLVFSQKCNYNFQKLMDIANGIVTVKGDTGDQGFPGSQGIAGDIGVQGFGFYDGVIDISAPDKDVLFGNFTSASGIRIGDFFINKDEGIIYSVTSLSEYPTTSVIDFNDIAGKWYDDNLSDLAPAIIFATGADSSVAGLINMFDPEFEAKNVLLSDTNYITGNSILMSNGILNIYRKCLSSSDIISGIHGETHQIILGSVDPLVPSYSSYQQNLKIFQSSVNLNHGVGLVSVSEGVLSMTSDSGNDFEGVLSGIKLMFNGDNNGGNLVSNGFVLFGNDKYTSLYDDFDYANDNLVSSALFGVKYDSEAVILNTGLRIGYSVANGSFIYNCSIPPSVATPPSLPISKPSNCLNIINNSFSDTNITSFGAINISTSSNDVYLGITNNASVTESGNMVNWMQSTVSQPINISSGESSLDLWKSANDYAKTGDVAVSSGDSTFFGKSGDLYLGTGKGVETGGIYISSGDLFFNETARESHSVTSVKTGNISITTGVGNVPVGVTPTYGDINISGENINITPGDSGFAAVYGNMYIAGGLSVNGLDIIGGGYTVEEIRAVSFVDGFAITNPDFPLTYIKYYLKQTEESNNNPNTDIVYRHIDGNTPVGATEIISDYYYNDHEYHRLLDLYALVHKINGTPVKVELKGVAYLTGIGHGNYSYSVPNATMKAEGVSISLTSDSSIGSGKIYYSFKINPEYAGKFTGNYATQWVRRSNIKTDTICSTSGLNTTTPSCFIKQPSDIISGISGVCLGLYGYSEYYDIASGSSVFDLIFRQPTIFNIGGVYSCITIEDVVTRAYNDYNPVSFDGVSWYV